MNISRLLELAGVDSFEPLKIEETIVSSFSTNNISRMLELSGIDILHEMRKNPKLNKKLGVWDLLQKYEDDPNIFIHFTNSLQQDYNFTYNGIDKKDKHYPLDDTRIDFNKIQIKLGVNPQYIHHNPIGIYGYPLSQYIRKIGRHFPDASIGGHEVGVFASEAPIIYVFKFVSGNLLRTSKYTKSYWQRDLKKLIQYNFDKDIIDSHNNNNNMSPCTKLILCTKSLSKGNVIEWTKILRTLGYDGIVFEDDTIRRLFDMNIIEAVFFTKSCIKVVDVIYKQQPTANNLDDAVLAYYTANEDAIRFSIKDDYNSEWLWGIMDQAFNKYRKYVRWPNAEKVLIKSPESAVKYAITVLQTRWTKAEKVIKTDPRLWKEYCKHFNIKNVEKTKSTDDQLPISKLIKIGQLNGKTLYLVPTDYTKYGTGWSNNNVRAEKFELDGYNNFRIPTLEEFDLLTAKRNMWTGWVLADGSEILYWSSKEVDADNAIAVSIMTSKTIVEPKWKSHSLILVATIADT